MEPSPNCDPISCPCNYADPGASNWGSLVNNRIGHCPCSGNLRLRISPQSSKSSNKRRSTSDCGREPQAAYRGPAACVVGTRQEDQWATESVGQCTNSNQARAYSSNSGSSSGHGCESHTQPSRRG